MVLVFFQCDFGSHGSLRFFKAYQNNASYLVPKKNSNDWRGPGGISAESVACGDFIAPY